MGTGRGILKPESKIRVQLFVLGLVLLVLAYYAACMIAFPAPDHQAIIKEFNQGKQEATKCGDIY